MHRLATTPGGWDSRTEGVVFIDQTPAPIVFLSAADTDISALSQALDSLPNDFSDIRSINLLQLQQQLTIDTYAEDVLSHAQLIILRLLGGRAYWSYGLEVLKETVAITGAALAVLPGEDRPDLDAMSHSTLPLSVVNQLWRYFTEGGIENVHNALLYASNAALSTEYSVSLPQPVPKVGVYLLPDSQLKNKVQDVTNWEVLSESANKKEQILNPSFQLKKRTARIGILFYRAHYLSGNTKIIDAIAAALIRHQLQPVPIYVSSLKALDVQASLISLCQPSLCQPSDDAGDDALVNGPVELLINTTSFAISNLDQTGAGINLWQQLDVPVLQAICSGSPRSQWQAHSQGLTPRDIAMNVALPEVDGRIVTRAVSFKAAVDSAGSEIVSQKSLQTDVVIYEPELARVDFVAQLAANWVGLRRSPVAERKVALILANYPNRDGRMANGVGLDTPQSCLNLLRAMKQAGYAVSDLPETGDALMVLLAAGVTNDPEGYGLRPVAQRLLLSDYQKFFETLPEAVRHGVVGRWGQPLDEWQKAGRLEQTKSESCLPISGVQFGNVFVGIQPSRGYDLDPSLNYHAPDLEPTHAYLGFYAWMRSHLQAQAIVHVGKHGNLEWLPGKGIALSEDCYPEAAFGPMPHFYPFIVNDPGEGAQAKRRSQAVILDHLTPPMTRAELYGPLQQLESLVDEYYEAQNLDPSRLKVIGPKIVALLQGENLQQDLSLSVDASSHDLQFSDLQAWLPQIDGYLCELKEAQIRDGLHVYGQCPQGEQLRDLVVAIARHPNRWHMGLTRAIAAHWQLDLDPLTDDPALSWTGSSECKNEHTQGCRTVGDVIERLELFAMQVASEVIDSRRAKEKLAKEKLNEQARRLFHKGASLSPVIDWMTDSLLPNLEQTTDEISNFLHGLNGGYISSGPSGAPTRNRPEVLPTGRNFYSVDIRAIPTESAWDVGRKAAELVVENYAQEEGEYPRTLGLSMWGTSAMRTGGDDISEALALLGVRPVWDGPSRRVIDFEILPLSLVGRPRVDVTLRVSGFFRDAFPNLISLFDQAVMAVSALDEPEDQNPLAAQVNKDYAYWQKQGLEIEQSAQRSRYRIFGSKPGAYGAGLQGLIEAQNWESDADLARAYINWSSYAYTSGEGGQADGHSAPEAFGQRLEQMQIVLQNQDNREHDLLDSDDYYQFQGGLTAAVKAKRGESPQTYFGDNAVPENPKVRSLKSEIARVYRSRVVNPKWIKGVMRHGYKGAFELSATVDYLFAYDATTGCAEDHMYTGVAEAYVFDPAVRAFVEKSNPWALRDMAERLLEAQQRGLWKDVSEEMVDGLRAIAHEAEGKVEAGLSNVN
ncbi:MAG: cobaltochelatase subunit CobN [Cyanobacteria bacterium J06650_10]